MTETMNPYPQASEAVDQHLSKAIESLETTTKDGFRRVEGQMRDMATKDAVNAQVARLDLRVDHVREKLDTGLETIEKEMLIGFAELRERDSERDAQFKAREDDRDKKYSRRVGWTITAVGVGVSVLSFVIQHFS